MMNENDENFIVKILFKAGYVKTLEAFHHEKMEKQHGNFNNKSSFRSSNTRPRSSSSSQQSSSPYKQHSNSLLHTVAAGSLSGRMPLSSLSESTSNDDEKVNGNSNSNGNMNNGNEGTSIDELLNNQNLASDTKMNDKDATGIVVGTNANDLYCPICKIYLSNKGNLRRHMVSKHSSEKEYKCNHCHKSFARSDELRLHIERVHLPGHGVMKKKITYVSGDNNPDSNQADIEGDSLDYAPKRKRKSAQSIRVSHRDHFDTLLPDGLLHCVETSTPRTISANDLCLSTHGVPLNDPKVSSTDENQFFHGHSHPTSHDHNHHHQHHDSQLCPQVSDGPVAVRITRKHSHTDDQDIVKILHDGHYDYLIGNELHHHDDSTGNCEYHGRLNLLPDDVNLFFDIMSDIQSETADRSQSSMGNDLIKSSSSSSSLLDATEKSEKGENNDEESMQAKMEP